MFGTAIIIPVGSFMIFTLCFFFFSQSVLPIITGSLHCDRIEIETQIVQLSTCAYLIKVHIVHHESFIEKNATTTAGDEDEVSTYHEEGGERGRVSGKPKYRRA